MVEMRCVRGGVRPNKPNQDGSAIGARRFCIEKLPSSVLELADRRRPHGPALTGSPMEAPLVGLGIVQTEGQTLDVAGSRAIGFELLQLSPAIPNLSGDGSAVKFDPGSGAR